MRRRNVLIGLAASATLPVGESRSQTYPTQTVKIIVPWPAGGGTDVITRVIADKLRPIFGQSFIVENKPGASGNLGTAAAAKSEPDGHTLVMVTITVAITPHLTTNAGYDPLTDLSPITLVASSPHILIVNPGLSVASVPELISLAKSKPGELTYASAGVGSPFHIAAELFNWQAGTRIRHVAYRGGAPAISDVVAGHVNMSFANLVAALPLVKGGQLRALGVTTSSRSRAALDIPTISEAGLSGYEFGSWFGFLAPSSTPKSIVERLDREIRNILRDPDVQQRLTLDGADLIAKGPQDFAHFLISEDQKWRSLISEAGIRAE